VELGSGDLLLARRHGIGLAFVALACDAAGDHRSAAIARKVALAAVAPAPVLLIADLGPPERFLNMTRIFKPRSPMNTGAWCLVAFSGSGALAVAADLIGRPHAARALGALTSLFGTYLGSYTGVLLACTAVPVWGASRTILGPAFVATATASGAAATRLVLVANGLPHGHPTRRALGTIETASMLAELSISALGERRLETPPRRSAAAAPACISAPPRASSRSVSRSAWPRARPARASTNLRASCTSQPLWLSASRGSTQEKPPQGTTRSWSRWPATDARRTTTTSSHGKSAPCRSGVPRCRCQKPRDEPTAKPSGAPASQSSGGCGVDERLLPGF
jgi:hypothetical protein